MDSCEIQWQFKDNYPILREGEFSRIMKKQYIKNRYRCPLCRAYNTVKPIKDEIRPVKHENDVVNGSRAMECNLCGVKFYEIFKLKTIEYIHRPKQEYLGG
jgi:hypothetical protein